MKKIFVVLFYFLFLSNVSASHLDLIPISGVYSSQYNLDNGSYFSSNQKKYFMDGRIVYCVEPGMPIYTNDYYGSDVGFSDLDKGIIDKIKLIGYFGYDYPGHQSDSYFLASQELIWELIGNNEVHFTTGINSTGDTVNIDYEKNEIMNLVNSYYVKPSFDGSLISRSYGSEYVLEDSNHVLSNYEVISSNSSVLIDGDNLIINFDRLGSDSIVLKRKKYDMDTSVFYADSSSQDFMFLRPDDVYSELFIESFVPMSNIHIEKNGDVVDGIDSSNNFIYSSKGLDNVHFGIYASFDIYVGSNILYFKDQLIQEVVTKGGVADSIDLPNGSYYVKELLTLDDFVLDDRKIDVILDNDCKEIDTYMVSLNNDRKRVFVSLQKNGEVFNSFLSNGYSYDVVPLEGVHFGLYSSSDIYDYSGNKIFNRDTLIREYVTDSSGLINDELFVPFGTYYFKELQSLPGYKIDDNIYEFDISGIKDFDVTFEPILNELVKGNLVINKVDSFGNRLEGCGFKVFDSSDNLIYEGITDSNGVISVSDLPYGKYYFYEVSAPLGYILDNRIYEVNINDDNDFIEVSVMNQRLPLTSDIYEEPTRFSMYGLGFGLLSLSLTVLYDKKNKVC